MPVYLQRFAGSGTAQCRILWIAIQIERALGDLDRAASYLLQLKSGFPDSPEA